MSALRILVRVIRTLIAPTATVLSYSCTCKQGFSGDGTICTGMFYRFVLIKIRYR